jgi:hypothetical protein
MDEARGIALETDYPYKHRMLKKAWKRLEGRQTTWSSQTNFLWLEKLSPDLREKVAPGAYQKYGFILFKASLHKRIEWKIVDKIGYELSASELKQGAKMGDQRSINILNRK